MNDEEYEKALDELADTLTELAEHVHMDMVSHTAVHLAELTGGDRSAVHRCMCNVMLVCVNKSANLAMAATSAAVKEGSVDFAAAKEQLLEVFVELTGNVEKSFDNLEASISQKH